MKLSSELSVGKRWLCFIFFALSAIYPSRRFILEYAFLFKASLFLLMFLACVKFIKSGGDKVNKALNVGIIFWLIGLILSSCFSKFSVRCGSEIDIPLAAMAFAFLFCSTEKTSFESLLRLFGGTLVLFSYFSICLFLACIDTKAFNTYPWLSLIVENLFNPLSVVDVFIKHNERINTPFDYINYAGLFAAVVLPFFTGLFAWERIRKVKILWGAGMLFAAAIIFSTKSRGAILSSTIAMSGIALIICVSKIRAQKGFGKIITIAIFFAVFAGVLTATNYRFKNLWRAIFSGNIAKVGGERLYLAKDGFKLFLEKPLVGHGITSSPLMYIKSSPKVVHHCWQIHVAPVQDLLEFGLIGFLGLAIVGGFVLFISAKILMSRSVDKNDKKIILGLAMSLLSYITFASEFSWDLFVVSATICTILGLIVTYYSERCSCNGSRSSFAKLLMAAAVIVCAYFSVRDLAGRYYFRQFLNASIADLDASEQFLKKAIACDSNNLYYYNQAGNIFGLRGYPASVKYVANAVKYLEKSIGVCSWQPHVLENLGTFYAFLGANKKAVNAYIASIKLLPYNSLAYIQLIDLLSKKFGKYRLASSWAGLGAFLNPALLNQFAFIDFFANIRQSQLDLLNYYDRAEVLDSSLALKSDWIFEKESRMYLVGNGNRITISDEVKAYVNVSNFFSANNLNALYDACEASNKMNVYMHAISDSTHSNRKILLHGIEGPSLFTFTLKQLSAAVAGNTYSMRKIYAAYKPADGFLEELSQKTLKLFSVN